MLLPSRTRAGTPIFDSGRVLNLIWTPVTPVNLGWGERSPGDPRNVIGVDGTGEKESKEYVTRRSVCGHGAAISLYGLTSTDVLCAGSVTT